MQCPFGLRRTVGTGAGCRTLFLDAEGTTLTDHAAIALVCRLYEAFEERDHDAVLAGLADDLRWQQAATAVPAAGAALIGTQDLLEQVILPLERDWDGFTEDVEDIVAADGHVVVTGTYRGNYRPLGRRLDAEFCHLWWVRNGEVIRFRQFTDTAAFDAATRP